MWEYIDIPTIVTGIVVVLFQEIWNDIKYIFRLLSNRIFKKIMYMRVCKHRFCFRKCVWQTNARVPVCPKHGKCE